MIAESIARVRRTVRSQVKAGTLGGRRPASLLRVEEARNFGARGRIGPARRSRSVQSAFKAIAPASGGVPSAVALVTRSATSRLRASNAGRLSAPAAVRAVSRARLSATIETHSAGSISGGGFASRPSTLGATTSAP